MFGNSQEKIRKISRNNWDYFKLVSCKSHDIFNLYITWQAGLSTRQQSKIDIIHQECHAVGSPPSQQTPLMASGKRRSEEYQQVIGYVRKPLAVKFKTYCRAKEVEISEVLEELIQKWVDGQGDLFDNNKNNE